MIRSILAILAGIAVLTAVSFGIEAVANPLMLRAFPEALPSRDAIVQSLPANLFLFAYTALSIAVGGYVAAWLALRAPVTHAVVMGAIQLAFNVGAMVSLPGLAPRRVWIAGMVLTLPAAWAGGILRAKRAESARVRR